MPHRHADTWETLAAWRAARRRFVLATVVETRGFTPRKGGTRMLIGEHGETHGTIGGGAIEHAVFEAARTLFERGGSTLLRRHLTQELGMCCGGEMAVHLELVEAAPQLIVFGAGHIAKPLAAIAAGCGFEVVVVDARPAWASEQRFPTATIVVEDPEDFARRQPPEPDAFAVVVTHDHGLDQRVVRQLIGRPLRFLGMIGSVPKQRKFAQRLRAQGLDEGAIRRLVTPLGLAIGAQTPEEIAVSVVAQLVAVRRGDPAAPVAAPVRSAAASEPS